MIMMLELFEYNAPLPDDVILALAITGSVRPDGQRHTGFVVRDLLDKVWLYHLGGNHSYERELLSSSYSYLIVPALEPETANSIVSLLLTILQNTSGKVPYSIAWDQENYISDNGEIIKTKPVDGFTCATFVLEILKRQGLDLINRSTWPLSDENDDWQNRILPRLGLSLESLMAQLEVIGKYPRIRPEEALGAGHLYWGVPLLHMEVRPAADEVMMEFCRLRSTPPQ